MDYGTIEELIEEAEFELGLKVGQTREDKNYVLENYKDLKLNYAEKLNKFKKGTKSRRYAQYELDIQLDMYEGKVSSDDCSIYSDMFHHLTYYYANKDDEINARRALQQIDSKLLQLKSEGIYNGKLLSDPTEIERIREQLSKEKSNIEQRITEGLEYQNEWLSSLAISTLVLANKNPKYSEFDYEYFSSDNPKLSSNIEEIGKMLEQDAIDLENKREYSDNKKRYEEIQEEMQKIEFRLSNEADQLNKGQIFLLKRKYKDLYKEIVSIYNFTPITFISEERENTSTIKKEEQKEEQKSNTSNVKKEEEKSYSRLVAAQNESKRRLKIKSISNTLSSENLKKKAMAIISGICLAGLAAAIHFSGIDPNEAVAMEIQSLNSFDACKEYLSMITPAMYGTLVTSALSISSYIKHKKNYDKANKDFYDMMDNRPEDYLDIVESQAKVM